MIDVRTFIRFVKECIKELLFIVGAWIKANILAFCGVTAFFVIAIRINPISTLENGIAWLILYAIFISATFDNKPNLQRTVAEDKYEAHERVNIKQNNISLINVFKNIKK